MKLKLEEEVREPEENMGRREKKKRNQREKGTPRQPPDSVRTKKPCKRKVALSPAWNRTFLYDIIQTHSEKKFLIKCLSNFLKNFKGIKTCSGKPCFALSVKSVEVLHPWVCGKVPGSSQCNQ